MYEENVMEEMAEETVKAEEVIDKPKKPGKFKRFGKKALKIAGIALGGLAAAGSIFKIGESYGTNKTLKTLDGYEINVRDNTFTDELIPIKDE